MALRGPRGEDRGASSAATGIPDSPGTFSGGGAVVRGLTEARMEWVFFTDGDGQFDIDELPKLINLLNTCDVAIGYRM